MIVYNFVCTEIRTSLYIKNNLRKIHVKIIILPNV